MTGRQIFSDHWMHHINVTKRARERKTLQQITRRINLVQRGGCIVLSKCHWKCIIWKGWGPFGNLRFTFGPSWQREPISVSISLTFISAGQIFPETGNLSQNPDHVGFPMQSLRRWPHLLASEQLYKTLVYVMLQQDEFPRKRLFVFQLLTPFLCSI